MQNTNPTSTYRLLSVCGVILWFSFLFIRPSQAQSTSSIPHLRKQGVATQLVVHDKPFLILGGELENSSASDLKYMKPVWPKLKAMRLNTILMPVYWELIEPQDGKFDFAMVDSLIFWAQNNDLKIVVLWFGTWKNSMSCYAPYWVKTNQEQFPRSRTKSGRAIEILTPFSDENRAADAKAFTKLMKHLLTIDGKQNTVVMIQVENEIGMIPEARDYCPEAEKAFAQQVPAELMAYLQKNKKTLTEELAHVWDSAGMKQSGTWEEVFGKGLHTDEIFMAWYFARYTNYVAQAGKKEYPLPMFVNTALIRTGYKPGQYPSAGPLPHLFDIWKAAAPEIDFLSPDIYFNNFVEWSTKFNHSGNPLFIPEAGNNQSLVNAYYAIAQLNAIGYSPFSIEILDNPETNQVSKGYDVLRQLSPFILSNQGKGTMAGALLDSANQKMQIKLGEYIFNVNHEYSWAYAARTEGENPRFGCIIIMLSPNEYIVAGKGVVVTIQTSSDDNTIAGIGSLDEGKFIDGKWIAGRRMNGDQSHQGRHLDLPGDTYNIQRVILYKYK